MIKTLSIRTREREELVDITGRVAGLAAGIKEGALTVSVPHTTAAVTANEHADPDVARDMLAALRRLVPEQGGYLHAEGNSDAHIKAGLLGSSLTVPIKDGRLLLGTWQGIFFAEFDGPRVRSCHVQTAETGPGRNV